MLNHNQGITHPSRVHALFLPPMRSPAVVVDNHKGAQPTEYAVQPWTGRTLNVNASDLARIGATGYYNLPWDIGGKGLGPFLSRCEHYTGYRRVGRSFLHPTNIPGYSPANFDRHSRHDRHRESPLNSRRHAPTLPVFPHPEPPARSVFVGERRYVRVDSLDWTRTKRRPEAGARFPDEPVVGNTGWVLVGYSCVVSATWPGPEYPSSCPHPAANGLPDRRRWLLLAAGPRGALVASKGGGGWSRPLYLGPPGTRDWRHQTRRTSIGWGGAFIR